MRAKKIVYEINNFSHIDKWYISKSDPEGLTYMSQWATSRGFDSPVNSKLLYGENKCYFDTPREALENFEKRLREETERSIELARENVDNYALNS